MTHRFGVPARGLLLLGAAACAVAPWLAWVGRGECGWFCYSPLATPEAVFPGRQGWQLATGASVALLALAAAALLLAAFPPAARGLRPGLAVLAGATAVWSLATTLTWATSRYAHHHPHPGFGYGPGGLLGAGGALLVVAGALLPARGERAQRAPRPARAQRLRTAPGT